MARREERRGGRFLSLAARMGTAEEKKLREHILHQKKLVTRLKRNKEQTSKHVEALMKSKNAIATAVRNALHVTRYA